MLYSTVAALLPRMSMRTPLAASAVACMAVVAGLAYAEPDNAPVIYHMPDIEVEPHTGRIAIQVTASDQDGDAVSLSVSGNPHFVSLHDGGSGNGSLVVNPASVADIGSYRVNITAAANLLSSSAVFTITVAADTTAPVIAAPADAAFEATAVLTPLGTADLGGVEVSDDRDPRPAVTNDAPGLFPLGATTVTWTATDSAGNTATDTQTVNITDTTPPVITVLPDGTFEATGTTTVLSPVEYDGSAATDIFWPVRVSSDAGPGFPLGVTVVTHTATDANGNVATATQRITVRDTTPPAFSEVPAPDIPVRVDAAPAPVTFPTPAAADAVDPSVDVSCDPASGSTFGAGTTAVTCTAVDDTGNTSAVTFDVVVTTRTDTSNRTTLSIVAATDGKGGFTTLSYPRNVDTVVIDSRTYAVVASAGDKGIQIIDITDPASPTATAAVTYGTGGFATIANPWDVDTVVIDSRTYAVVAASTDNGIRIIDITDPASPNATAAVTYGTGGFTTLSNPWDVDTVVIDSRTYAVVAAYDDNGIQIIDITDPASPNATAAVTDGTGGFTTLAGAINVDTVTIGPRTYAVVAAYTDNGIQIIDITDPASPNATAAVTDGTGGFTTLAGAVNVDTVTIGPRTYAVVAAYDDNAVQIIDITDPASPNATAAVTDGTGGFTTLRGALDVDTVTIGPRTYAVVAAYDDNGIQIIDITDPASPNATAAATDGEGGFTTLAGASGVDTVTIGTKTYAAVTAFTDYSGVKKSLQSVL